MTTIAEIDGWKLTREHARGPLAASRDSCLQSGRRWRLWLTDAGSLILEHELGAVVLPRVAHERLIADYERRKAER